MSKTLLLADDSVTIQKVVGISFANEDIVLLTVDNGDDAIARAREARPDIVLADVVMPGKNGYEVCEAIKSDPELAGVPVLLLTGTFEPFDEERAARAGADGHITKPFEAQALVDHVNAMLAHRESQARASSLPAAAPGSPEPAAAPQAFEFFDEAAGSEGEEAALEIDERAPDTGFDLDAPIDLGEPPERGLDTAPTAPPPVEPPARAAAPPSEAPAWPTPPSPPAATPPPPPPPDPAAWNDMTGGGPFDLGFIGSGAPEDTTAPPTDDDPLADLEPEQLAAEAVLDPEAAAGHEVSSSDLGDPLADLDAPTAPPAEPSGPAAEPPRFAPPPPPPAFDTEPMAPPPPLAEPEPMAFAEPEATAAHLDPDHVPLAEPVPFDDDEVGFAAPVGALDASEPAEPPAFAPLHAEAPPVEMPTAPTLGAPERAPRSTPAATVPAPEPTPEPAAPARPEPPAPATALSPEWSARIHESVEKVAWEAFGDLSERIVREAVARVEAVAWEVIPQMAEALIREEIARLRDEEPES